MEKFPQTQYQHQQMTSSPAKDSVSSLQLAPINPNASNEPTFVLPSIFSANGQINTNVQPTKQLLREILDELQMKDVPIREFDSDDIPVSGDAVPDCFSIPLNPQPTMYPNSPSLGSNPP
ncbi:hypothetical protein GEMRC1_010484 [Eukaryota sp. GEM-RC1]